MEKINAGQNFEVVVDYAHTPDHLKQFTKLTIGIKIFACLVTLVVAETNGKEQKWVKLLRNIVIK